MKHPIVSMLATNVAVLIITVLISVLSLQDKVVPARLEPLAYVAFGVLVASCVLFITILYFKEAAGHLRLEWQKYRAASKADKARAAIPGYAHVVDRRDRLVVDSHGNGTLEWSFEMDKLEIDHRESLEFQLYADHAASANGNMTQRRSSIQVIDLQVGKNKVSHPESAYEMREIRQVLTGAGGFVEFGVLRVPIDFADLKALRRVPIAIKIRMEKTFTTLKEGDFLVVECPHLTSRIHVTIEAAESTEMVIIPATLADKKIRAQMGYSGTEDVGEGLKQRARVKQTGNAVIWESEYPKLGYRYSLYFQVVSRRTGVRRGHEGGASA